MHVKLGGTTSPTCEVVPRSTWTARRSAGTSPRRSSPSPTTPSSSPTCPDWASTVQRGPTLDGLGNYYREKITESPRQPVDVVAGPARRRRRRAGLLPARRLASRRPSSTRRPPSRPESAFVNCMPVFIASDPAWAKRFADAGVPIIGDDIKSQVGATIIHRMLAQLFEDRGVKLDHTYQLNFGGNMDFMNMLERERLTSKKISKTQSVQSQLERPLQRRTSTSVPRTTCRGSRTASGRTSAWRAATFGDVPLSVELKLEVWDSPNSAGIVIDAIRCAKLALDRGIGGPLIGPSSLLHEVAAGAVLATTRPTRWSRSSSSATAPAKTPTGPRSSTSSPAASPTPARFDGRASPAGARPSRLGSMSRPARAPGGRSPPATIASCSVARLLSQFARRAVPGHPGHDHRVPGPRGAVHRRGAGPGDGHPGRAVLRRGPARRAC